MEEKILSGKKHGMSALLGVIVIYILALAGIVAVEISSARSIGGIVLEVVCMIIICTAWILLLGLKVLKPQEALVLTLFGKYIGTLKD